MAVPVRINEDNYVKLQKEAERERRSVVSQLNVILDERYGRNTVGNLDETPAVVHPAVADLLRNGDLKSGETVKYTGEPSEPDFSANELDCCQHPSRPCKHWQWNVDQAGYVNILSGRYREAD